MVASDDRAAPVSSVKYAPAGANAMRHEVGYHNMININQ
jgi:hypothetical protein